MTSDRDAPPIRASGSDAATGTGVAVGDKPYAPACDRNRDPILAVLRECLADCRHVLEIGSGTGQHAVHFAAAMPWLTWQCSDRPQALPGIARWLDDAGLPNTPPARALDMAWPDWAGRVGAASASPRDDATGDAMPGDEHPGDAQAARAPRSDAMRDRASPSGPPPPDVLPCDVDAMPFDAMFSANTLHIMGWPAVRSFFDGVGRLLADAPGAVLVVYGPFNRDGRYTSDSNRDFDGWLKARDPASGLRDFEAVDALARAAGLRLVDDLAMPANNRCVVWRRAPGPGGGAAT